MGSNDFQRLLHNFPEAEAYGDPEFTMNTLRSLVCHLLAKNEQLRTELNGQRSERLSGSSMEIRYE